MKQFLRWAQVQRRLTEHAQATGSPYGFFDAVRELWEDGQFQSAPALPSVSFLDWDGSDLDELERLLDQAPVDLDSFYQDFERGRTASDAAGQITDLNITIHRTARHQAQGAHNHNSFEIDYVARGNARLICGGSSRTLPAGSLCMVSPRFLHEAVAGEDCILLSIMLSEQNIENTLFRLLQQESLVSDFFRFGLQDPRSGYILFHHLNPRAILPLFRGLLHEFYSGDDYFREACANYLELLFVYLLRQGGEYHDRPAPAGHRREAVSMMAVLKHIQTNYKTTSLHETAALFHYEPSYLGKQIKLHTGKNYSRLVSDLRMADAKRLLRNSDLTVEKVAEACGYQSLVHFSRSFRKCFGASPSAWRRSEDLG